MNIHWNFISSFLFLNFLMLNCNNCSPVHDPFAAPSSSSSDAVLDVSSPQALKAQQILSTYCTSCHGSSPGAGGVSNITNLQGLVSQGVVIPGNATGSTLYRAVKSQAMPPGAPLSSADQQALNDWISSGLITAPTPSPTPTPSTGPPPVTNTYASISATILVPKCVSCHGASLQGGGFRLDNYANVMMTVQAGNLSSSPLYIQAASGTMPKNAPVLSTGEVQSIGQWILNGAKNN